MDYRELIKNLVKQEILKTPLIIESFENINRADFVPAELENKAGANAPLPIGAGQTISQPLTVAFMLELLQPRLGDKILDVGFGSGWTSALLGWCVGEKGKVFAIERLAELCEFGKKNIMKYNFINKGVVRTFCDDGSRGLAGEAPFDKILVSAAAPKIPPALKEQLAIGGRLVIPVRESIWLVIRKAENKYQEEEFPGFAFVPLVDGR